MTSDQSGRRTRSLVELRELRYTHAWNVRGDPQRPAFLRQAQEALGWELPVHAGASNIGSKECSLWLGPRSWLWLAERAAVPFDHARRTINAAGGALFDISSSQVAWSICGTSAGRVLNRLCPLDLDLRAFPAGRCAHSLLGHIAALVFRPGAQPCFVVMVARSLARDAWHGLRTAAETDGYSTAEPVWLSGVLRP